MSSIPISDRVTVKEVLELSSNPTLQEINSNYRRLALQYHPDRNKSLEAQEYMTKLNKAYAIAIGKFKEPKKIIPSRNGIVINITRYFDGVGSDEYLDINIEDLLKSIFKDFR